MNRMTDILFTPFIHFPLMYGTLFPWIKVDAASSLCYFPFSSPTLHHTGAQQMGLYDSLLGLHVTETSFNRRYSTNGEKNTDFNFHCFLFSHLSPLPLAYSFFPSKFGSITAYVVLLCLWIQSSPLLAQGLESSAVYLFFLFIVLPRPGWRLGKIGSTDSILPIADC